MRRMVGSDTIYRSVGKPGTQCFHNVLSPKRRIHFVCRIELLKIGVGQTQVMRSHFAGDGKSFVFRPANEFDRLY